MPRVSLIAELCHYRGIVKMFEPQARRCQEFELFVHRCKHDPFLRGEMLRLLVAYRLARPEDFEGLPVPLRRFNVAEEE